MKFATVLGAPLGKSWTTILPWVVAITAYTSPVPELVDVMPFSFPTVFISVSLLLFSISEAVSRSFVRASRSGAGLDAFKTRRLTEGQPGQTVLSRRARVRAKPLEIDPIFFLQPLLSIGITLGVTVYW